MKLTKEALLKGDPDVLSGKEPSAGAIAVLSGELVDLGDVRVPDDEVLAEILRKVYRQQPGLGGNPQ